MNPETIHNLMLESLHTFPSLPRTVYKPFRSPTNLHQTLWGLSFHHPVGLAAGLDKNGEAVDGLLNCGFSFVEVGTVTPQPQPGNPSPRLFRLLEDQALINRMGFNNKGAVHLVQNLEVCRRSGIVGINIGKNKTTPNDDALSDYLACLHIVLPYADYVVLNVSSPNTPGLRDLQSEDTLIPLVEHVLRARNGHTQSGQRPVPVLVKLSPDMTLDAVQSLAERLLSTGIDGFIATNTTVTRDHLQSSLQHESGGLSGQPLTNRSTEVIRALYRTTEGKVPIVGSGGVMSSEDAWNKILAGANLIQLYTGFIYHGPPIVQQIVRDLHKKVQEQGFTSIEEAVGAEARIRAILP